MKDEIKGAIDKILTGTPEGIHSSVNYAKYKVDSIFAKIEERVYTASADIGDAETLNEAKHVAQDLQDLYEEL